jgi:hypothetical protein
VLAARADSQTGVVLGYGNFFAPSHLYVETPSD